MGVYSLDVEVQAILQYGWDYIRANIDVLDEIFDNFKSDHLKNRWGDREIKKIKEWVQTTDIPIVLAWSLNPQRIPCLSVHIAQSAEDVANAFMGDHGGIESQPKDARTIVAKFVPAGFDADEGTVEAPATVDLDQIPHFNNGRHPDRLRPSRYFDVLISCIKVLSGP